jgi:hypothetical protein
MPDQLPIFYAYALLEYLDARQSKRCRASEATPLASVQATDAAAGIYRRNNALPARRASNSRMAPKSRAVAREISRCH